MLRYAYNTNGCTHYRLQDAIQIMHVNGYQGIALTLDWHHLDPFGTHWEYEARGLSDTLASLQMSSVIETGARYLLSTTKHAPTLLHPTREGRNLRIRFLKRAIDIAAILGSETVSFWAGICPENITRKQALLFLKEGLEEICAYAEKKNIILSFEPEPGMLIETISEYKELCTHISEDLHLALDIGHVWVTGEMNPKDAVAMHASHCGTFSVEGMQQGVHVHLPLDQGNMDVRTIIHELIRQEFTKLVCVELSRESHRAHLAIPESIAMLREWEAAYVPQNEHA